MQSPDSVDSSNLISVILNNHDISKLASGIVSKVKMSKLFRD